MEVDHYETEYEGKENSLRLCLPQPSQHSDKAEMDEYCRIRRSLSALKANNDYEEKLFEEAV